MACSLTPQGLNHPLPIEKEAAYAVESFWTIAEEQMSLSLPGSSPSDSSVITPLPSMHDYAIWTIPAAQTFTVGEISVTTLSVLQMLYPSYRSGLQNGILYDWL
jgi:hypothetical protein